MQAEQDRSNREAANPRVHRACTAVAQILNHDACPFPCKVCGVLGCQESHRLLGCQSTTQNLKRAQVFQHLFIWHEDRLSGEYL